MNRRRRAHQLTRTLFCYVELFCLFILLVQCSLKAAEAVAPSTTISNRIGIAILGINNTENLNALLPWQNVETRLIMFQLKQIKPIYTPSLASVESVKSRLKLSLERSNIIKQSSSIRNCLQAQYAFYGNLIYRDDGLHFTGDLIDLQNNETVQTINTASSNPYAIADKIVEQILGILHVVPTFEDSTKMQKRWTYSLKALEYFGNSNYGDAVDKDPKFVLACNYLSIENNKEGRTVEAIHLIKQALLVEPNNAMAHALLGAYLLGDDQLSECENELNMAIKLDNDDATSYANLGMMYLKQDRTIDSIKAFKAAITTGPNEINLPLVRAQLAFALSLEGERAKSLSELAQIGSENYTSNIWTEYYIGKTYSQLLELNLAIEHCEKFIEIANNQKINKEYVESTKLFVNNLKLRKIITYVNDIVPKFYDDNELEKIIDSKLSKEEYSLVEKPLTYNSKMNKWALELTARGTNDIQKAQLLFDGIAHRARKTPRLPSRLSNTAIEVFSDLDKEGRFLYCQQASFLFVALARSIHLQSYPVQVNETYDGYKGNHMCAAVFLKSGVILVDLSYYWFGVPHKKYTILNDLQTIATHLSPIPDLKLNQIAFKLAPELPLVQYNYCWELIDDNNWSQASKLMEALMISDRGGAKAKAIEAAFAAHQGHMSEAEQLLKDAIAINSTDYYLYARLGNIYLSQDKRTDAENCFRRALNCPHTEEDTVAIQHILSQFQQTPLSNH